MSIWLTTMAMHHVIGRFSNEQANKGKGNSYICLLYTSPSAEKERLIGPPPTEIYITLLLGDNALWNFELQLMLVYHFRNMKISV